MAFPGFSWGSCSLGVLDSFTLLALLLFRFLGFPVLHLFRVLAFLHFGLRLAGVRIKHKTEGVLCLFLSYYTTFPEVFNVLDLLDYAERGVKEDKFLIVEIPADTAAGGCSCLLVCLRDYYTSAEILYAMLNT